MDKEIKRVEGLDALQFMKLAMAEARKSRDEGEVPVGSVLVHNDHVLAVNHNRMVQRHDPTAHAEILVLRTAGELLQNYRLVDCDLYSTLEPCAMCAGAIVHSRIRGLFFSIRDPKSGAAGGRINVFQEGLLNHTPDIHVGLLADESEALLVNFFKQKRRRCKGYT